MTAAGYKRVVMMNSNDQKSNVPDQAGPEMADKNGSRHVVRAVAGDTSALEAENGQLRDRLLRAVAETDNVRRRGERAVEDAGHYAVAKFAREVVAVSDNLQRAIVASETTNIETAGKDTLSDGVRATELLLASILERFEVRKIDAVGSSFDPNLHEAVMEIADIDHPPATVLKVLEDGYSIHGRLLRPARVVVSAKGGSPPPRG